MKRILFVGWYPNPIEPYKNVFFRNLIYAFADMGYDCSVVSPVSIIKYRKKTKTIPNKNVDFTSKGSKVDVFYPRMLSFSSKNVLGFKTGRLSERFFEKSAVKCVKKMRIDFDAVYGHFFMFGGLAAIKIGRIFKKPSFVAYGECDYESQILIPYGDLTKKDVNGLSGIISVSSSNTSRLEKINCLEGIPVLTAPNSTDLDMFTKREKIESRKALGLPQDKFIIGFVGGFIERKGISLLEEAINDLPNEICGAYAGKGPLIPSGEKVLLAEPIPHNQIPVFLNSIDIFCLPTINEGSCNSIIEAMACGKPIISSNLPFNDDILGDGYSIRVNPLSKTEICNAIMQIYENQELYNKMCENSFAASSNFDINTRATKISNFINKIIYDKK